MRIKRPSASWCYLILAGLSGLVLFILFFSVNEGSSGRDVAIGILFGAIVLFGERAVAEASERETRRLLRKILLTLDPTALDGCEESVTRKKSDAHSAHAKAKTHDR